MVPKIKNPKRLYLKYLKQFYSCFGTPLTSTEIINRVKKENKNTKININSFYTQYLNRLKNLALISKIEPNGKNKYFLKRFYGKECEDERKVYYFFTPQSSYVLLSLNNLMKKFEDYLSNKKEIIKKINLLLNSLMDYEFVSNTNQEFLEFSEEEKRKFLREAKKIKPKNKKGEEMKKRFMQEIKGKRKIEFYEGFLKMEKLLANKDFFKHPKNLEFTKLLLGRALKNKPFQMLVKSATVFGTDESNFCIPMFHEAIINLKLIDERTEDLMNTLNQNIQINLMDVLNKESGFIDLSKLFEQKFKNNKFKINAPREI